MLSLISGGISGGTCSRFESGSSSLDGAKEVPEVNGTVLLPTGGPLKGGKILLRPCSGVRNARKLSGDINDWISYYALLNCSIQPLNICMTGNMRRL